MQPFDDIPDDIVPLTAHFKNLLTLASAQQPFVFFLDSVDQLTGTQDTNHVSWIPTRLPAHCKVSREQNGLMILEYEIISNFWRTYPEIRTERTYLRLDLERYPPQRSTQMGFDDLYCISWLYYSTIILAFRSS